MLFRIQFQWPIFRTVINNDWLIGFLNHPVETTQLHQSKTVLSRTQIITPLYAVQYALTSPVIRLSLNATTLYATFALKKSSRAKYTTPVTGISQSAKCFEPNWPRKTFTRTPKKNCPRQTLTPASSRAQSESCATTQTANSSSPMKSCSTMRSFNARGVNLRARPSTAQQTDPQPKRFNIRSAVRYILSGVEPATPDTPA